jgi:cyclopropane fatty-acyl-phospholipid synthase-like methyltransferase
MNISTSQIIKDWVPNDSKVIDFGCGDGSLLKDLINEKNASGYGVEIDLKKYRNVL